MVGSCHSAVVIPHSHPSVQIQPLQPSRVKSYWSVCWHSFVSSSKGVRECDSLVHAAWSHDGSAAFIFNSVYEGGQWAAVLSGSVTLKAPVCLWPLAWRNTMWWHVRRKQLPSWWWCALQTLECNNKYVLLPESLSMRFQRLLRLSMQYWLLHWHVICYNVLYCCCLIAP